MEKNILKEVSKKTKFSIEECSKVYNYYWQFIHDTIVNLPLKNMSDAEFKQFNKGINIPNIGKFYFKRNDKTKSEMILVKWNDRVIKAMKEEI